MKFRNRTLYSLLICAGLLPGVAAAASLPDVMRNCDSQSALAAIRAGADVNAQQPDGTTPLLWAVYCVDYDAAAELLARGAKPDVRNSLGATALAEAVNLADQKLVGLLLKAKADPNLGTEEGQTPLMLAARTGSLPIDVYKRQSRTCAVSGRRGARCSSRRPAGMRC